MIEELKKEIASLEERFITDEPVADLEKEMSGGNKEEPTEEPKEEPIKDPVESPKQQVDMKPKEEFLLAIDVAMEGLALAKKIIDEINDANADEILDDEACEKFEDLMDFVEAMDSQMDDLLDTGDDEEPEELDEPEDSEEVIDDEGTVELEEPVEDQEEEE